MTQFDLFGEIETHLDQRSHEREPQHPKPKSETRPRRRRPIPPQNPHVHARQLAERIAHAWHSNYGGSSLEIPIGTVAALTLLQDPPVDGPDLADQILERQPTELPQLLEQIWGMQWLHRPDLIERALPLHRWLQDDDRDRQRLIAVHAVVHTVVTGGLLHLTGSPDPYDRSTTDILSHLLMEVRSKSARKGTGEFHTSAEVCDLMAAVTIPDADSLQPGQWIAEPAIGSGGMFRATAQRLRELHLSPHDYRWYGIDIDPIAAACAAVNAVVWGLGPHVVIARGNALDPDVGLEQALTERQAVIEHRKNVVAQAQAAALLGRVDRLVDGAADTHAARDTQRR